MYKRQADELKTIAAAVNYLSEHGISNLDELDASLSSVSDRAVSYTHLDVYKRQTMR